VEIPRVYLATKTKLGWINTILENKYPISQLTPILKNIKITLTEPHLENIKTLSLSSESKQEISPNFSKKRNFHQPSKPPNTTEIAKFNCPK
jgi:hypothetical protein